MGFFISYLYVHVFFRLQQPCVSANEIHGHAKYGTMTLGIKWKVDTGKCVDASPLVVRHPLLTPTPGPDNSTGYVVYIGSHSRLFIAINWVSGHTLWKVELPDRIESSAVISECGQYVTVGKSTFPQYYAYYVPVYMVR